MNEQKKIKIESDIKQLAGEKSENINQIEAARKDLIAGSMTLGLYAVQDLKDIIEQGRASVKRLENAIRKKEEELGYDIR